MNKLKENKQTLDDAEMLIRMLNEEVNMLRNIVGRYYIKKGSFVAGGSLTLDDCSDFVLSVNESDQYTYVNHVNHKDLGFKSRFMKIQELNNKLGL